MDDFYLKLAYEAGQRSGGKSYDEWVIFHGGSNFIKEVKWCDTTEKQLNEKYESGKKNPVHVGCDMSDSR